MKHLRKFNEGGSHDWAANAFPGFSREEIEEITKKEMDKKAEEETEEETEETDPRPRPRTYEEEYYNIHGVRPYESKIIKLSDFK